MEYLSRFLGVDVDFKRRLREEFRSFEVLKILELLDELESEIRTNIASDGNKVRAAEICSQLRALVSNHQDRGRYFGSVATGSSRSPAGRLSD